MKRIFAFLLLMIIPTFCFGDVINNFNHEQTLDVEKILSKQLPIIEEKMKRIYSDTNYLNKITQKEGNDVKKIITIYNNLLSEKIFNDYKNFFMWLIEQKSKQTGRVIKESKDFETVYWLDAGIMDSEQCNGGTYNRKNNGKKEHEKYFKDFQEHTCLYPEGFEDFTISLIEYNDEHKLFVIIDNASSNIRSVYDITLTADDNIDNSVIEENVFFFSSTKQTYDYHDYYIYINGERSSIINDKIWKEPLPKSKIEQYSFDMDSVYTSWKHRLK